MENEKDDKCAKLGKLSPKKRLFVKAYLENLGSITGSANQVKIHRNTYYLWLEEDKEFKEYIESIDIDDYLLGEAKKALLKNIQKGDVASVIFTLKSKGKNEGFTEKQEVAHSGGFTLNETRTYQEKPPQEKDE